MKTWTANSLENEKWRFKGFSIKFCKFVERFTFTILSRHLITLSDDVGVAAHFRWWWYIGVVGLHWKQHLIYLSSNFKKYWYIVETSPLSIPSTTSAAVLQKHVLFYKKNVFSFLRITPSSFVCNCSMHGEVLISPILVNFSPNKII